MTGEIILNGMTWNHPRGIDPLLATSGIWRERTGVDVRWDARSLQDFESYPLRQLAECYDLIVIDHPHVGQIAEDDCLLPLDGAAHAGALAALEKGSVGPSFASYWWSGRLWALPLDAAAQVQAWNPQELPEPVQDWREVMALARRGRVSCPLRPPHSLMSFFTLCGQAGWSCGGEEDTLIDGEAGTWALEILRELIAHLDPADMTRDPIATYEAMAQPGAACVCAPLIYGYVNYARAGFRPVRIACADIPTVKAGAGHRGSILGGTGIAVSRACRFAEQAVAFAFWLASAETQAHAYVEGGGQPAHAVAWDDPAVNASVMNFYRTTRTTLDGARLRPRHNGYMRFQHDGSLALNEALQSSVPSRRVVSRLNDLYRRNLLS